MNKMTYEQAELDFFADVNDIDTKFAVANNKNTHPSTLRKLMNKHIEAGRENKSFQVVIAILQNANTTSETLRDAFLAMDDNTTYHFDNWNINARYQQLKAFDAIASHKNTSIEILKKIRSNHGWKDWAGRCNDKNALIIKNLVTGMLETIKKRCTIDELKKKNIDINVLSPEKQQFIKNWNVDDIVKYIEFLKAHGKI